MIAEGYTRVLLEKTVRDVRNPYDPTEVGIVQARSCSVYPAPTIDPANPIESRHNTLVRTVTWYMNTFSSTYATNPNWKLIVESLKLAIERTTPESFIHPVTLETHQYIEATKTGDLATLPGYIAGLGSLFMHSLPSDELAALPPNETYDPCVIHPELAKLLFQVEVVAPEI